MTVPFPGSGSDAEAICPRRVDHFLDNAAANSVRCCPPLGLCKIALIENDGRLDRLHRSPLGRPVVRDPTSVFSAWAMRHKERNVMFLSPLSIPPTSLRSRPPSNASF